LGDLARYKELHAVVEGRAADWSVAASYYQQSSKLWPHDGNSHNQVFSVSVSVSLSNPLKNANWWQSEDSELELL
jgi:hypothetical protein